MAAKTGEKIVSDLAERIKAKIGDGTYVPGGRLRQASLAEAFGVSRTPVREALKQLEAMGLVFHVPHQGAIVRIPDAREIREAYQLRAELESLAAELAINWITDEQVERMRAAQRQFAQIVKELATPNTRSQATRNRKLDPDSPKWIDANEAFHDVILEASGNRRLRRVVDDLHLNFTRRIMLSASLMDGRRMRENVVQHDAILQAIERHDPTEARRAMKHHVLRSGELLVWWLEGGGGVS